MNFESKNNYHIKQVKVFDDSIVSCKRQLMKFSLARLIIFLATIFGSIYLWEISRIGVFALINIAAVVFIFLMRREAKLHRLKVFYKNLKDIHLHEIKLLHRDFEGLDQGEQFQKAYHNYSRDLDIFGLNSIYQLLNRTCTYSGSSILAESLNTPPLEKKEINYRQSAVQELATKEEWCYEFLAYGKGTSEKAGTREIISTWLEDKNHFGAPIVNWIRIALPAISVLIGILAAFDIISWIYFLGVFVFQLLITLVFNSKINNIHGKLSKKYAIIDKYLDIVKSIENQSFKTSLLKRLQGSFINSDEKFRATKSLKRLRELLDILDARLNVYMAILLNGLFLWDLNTAFKVEKWRIKNKAQFKKWMLAIGEFDALISIALFAVSNPEYTFPEISEGRFKIKGTGLGHPLIDKTKLVKNDYTIEGDAKIDLLTGANMAGKSTFLRTVGVNIVLARIGAPVCADELHITPIRLFSSLRTIDSLRDNESFFYAELKRLQTLITLYRNKFQYFFLLDEILKGTNSTDQHKGSIGLIKKILSLEGRGIIATHDLALATLQEEFPEHIRNLCFEIEIDNNKLKFDYKLNPGFCKTLNASFLMQVMEII